VTVRCGAAAAWRAHGDGVVAGPEGGEEPFDAVVVNADPLARSDRAHGPLALSGYVLLLAADVRATLPHHVVAFARDAKAEFTALFEGRVPDELTLYVCHPAATDASLAPPGRSGLFVMVNAPPLRSEEDAAAWPAHAARLRERCIARVRALSPELGRARLEVLGERTPVDFSRQGAPGGSIYGFLPHGKLGPFRRPRMRAATRGDFYS